MGTFDGLFTTEGIKKPSRVQKPLGGRTFEGLFEKPEITEPFREPEPILPPEPIELEEKPSFFERIKGFFKKIKVSPIAKMFTEPIDEPEVESKVKDVFDALYSGAANIWHRSKQAFLSALPNYVFKDIPEEQIVKMEAGMPGQRKKAEAINKKNKELREKFKEKYIKAETKYQDWVKAHPELEPRKEWERGTIETIKENPKILLDPAYWLFVAAKSASFTIGVIGTTMAVTAATKNPIAGLTAGVTVAAPMQIQDLYEDLIENGATEELATKLSVPIGAVIAMVEVAGDLPLLKAISKPFSHLLSRNISKVVAEKTMSYMVKKGIKTFTAIEIAEMLEEIVQGAIQDATVKTVNENREILANIPETMVSTLMATTPFALLGAGGAMRAKTKLPKVEEEKLVPPKEVKPPAKPTPIPKELEPLKVYRGGEAFEGKVGDRGLPVTTNKEVAQRFLGAKKDFRKGVPFLEKPSIGLEEYTIDPSAKIATRKDIPIEVFNKYKAANPVMTPEKAEPILGKWAKENGFDAIDYRTLGKTAAKEAEIKILNPNILKPTEIKPVGVKGIEPKVVRTYVEDKIEFAEIKAKPLIDIATRTDAANRKLEEFFRTILPKVTSFERNNALTLLVRGETNLRLDQGKAENVIKLYEAYQQKFKPIKPKPKLTLPIPEQKQIAEENKKARKPFELKRRKRIQAEEASIKLTSGIDPGVDKFIAEDVKPFFTKIKDVVAYLGRTVGQLPKLIINILEPSKLVERNLGGVPYALSMRGIHKPEAKLIQFNQERLESLDKNFVELEKWFAQFSDKELENFMLSRGVPMTAEALQLQADAIKELPSELKNSKIRKVVQEIADFNFAYLTKVMGGNIGKVEDYFYGVYKNTKKVTRFLDYWKTTKRFTKEKKLPTVADAIMYGLELRDKNPIINLRNEYRDIAKLEGMNWMRDELLRTGWNRYITETENAPMDWDIVDDPIFAGLKLEPSLAKLVNNLISTNKITRQPVLNAWRRVNNFLRSIKFIGSAFHLAVEAKQSVADSGYVGFMLGKKTALRGITKGFTENDPIFLTREYQDYIELGGGHKYSIEAEAQTMLSDMVDKINRGNYLGALTKVGIITAKIPTGFVKWMFDKYIPKVKYSKYLDFVAVQEKRKGRKLTDNEKINIIKEGQNFYGMMNERLFGRSGTMTTILRFIFMAPGFAEGNFRTILKSMFQWGVKGTYRAGRSRFNVVNSLLLTGMLATIGTLIFTGEPPEKPKKLEDIRDLFKIDTGYRDDKGRKIMIDLLTYDKDYWNVYFNVLRGRADIAIASSIKRLGGMKASALDILSDFGQMFLGKAIFDWKGDRVVNITDPLLEKVMKIAVHEIKKIQPISFSVYLQSRRKGVDILISAVEAMVGVRPAKSEEDKREQELINKIWSLKDQQEELYRYLGSIDNPRKAIKKYNSTVDRILDSKLVSQELKDEWEPKLKVDIERLVSNKVYQLTNPFTTVTPEEKNTEIEKIKKWLSNFGISIDQAQEYLKLYWKEHPVKNKWDEKHLQNMRIRRKKLRQLYQ